MLLIVVLCLRARPAGGGFRFPRFVLAFAAVALAGSLGLVPEGVTGLAAEASGWMLVVAISAVGVKTSVRAMIEVGGGHIGIVVIETLVLLGAAPGVVAYL